MKGAATVSRSAERRALRPYENLGAIQEAFDQITLSIGNQEPYAHGSTVRLSGSSFVNEHIYIDLAADADGFAQLTATLLDTATDLEISPDQIDLLIVTSGVFTRRADVICSFPLSEIKEQDHKQRVVAPAHTRWPSTLNAGKGFFIDVYCALGQDIKRRPLRPSRKGTWLAHAGFKISTDQDTTSFETLALTDNVKEKYGLVGHNIVKYAHVDADPTEPGSLESDIILYVDQTTLNLLDANSNSEGASLWQRQLFLDIVGALVTRSSVELNRGTKTLADIENSILSRIINGLADNKEDRESYLQMITDFPSQFVAHIENTLSQSGARRFTEQVKESIEGAKK